MLRIDVKADIKKAVAQLDAVHKKQIPFAVSKAINEVLKTSAPAVKDEMRRVFDRPTPWTLNSYRVLKWANKRSLTGVVGFKGMDYRGGPGGKASSAAGVYLQPHMEGGSRAAKGLERLLRNRGLIGSSEFLVPSKFARLDQYGNVSRGTIQKVLANLGALNDPHSNTPRGGARGGKKRAEYFFTRRGVKGQRLTAIWQTFGAKGGHNAVPVFIVVSGAPKYKRVFDQEKVVKKEVDRRFAPEFDKAMAFAIATAK